MYLASYTFLTLFISTCRVYIVECRNVYPICRIYIVECRVCALCVGSTLWILRAVAW
jgi:hypothetical protein